MAFESSLASAAEALAAEAPSLSGVENAPDSTGTSGLRSIVPDCCEDIAAKKAS